MPTLKSELSQFIGSEQLYFNPLYRAMRYTDGVKYFANTAGAYWLLDIIGTEYHPKTVGQRPEWDYFLSIKMEVKDSEAGIRVTDGNDTTFVERRVDFTDCPEGQWNFYLTNNVLLLPSEY